MSNTKTALFILIVIPFTLAVGVFIGDRYNKDLVDKVVAENKEKLDLETVQTLANRVFEAGQQDGYVKGWNECVKKVHELEAEQQKKENGAVPQRHDIERPLNTSSADKDTPFADGYYYIEMFGPFKTKEEASRGRGGYWDIGDILKPQFGLRSVPAGD